MPKIVATGAGWFNLDYFIMAEYIESAPGKRKLRVTMDEGQTRDLDEPDAARLVPRLDALDTQLADQLGIGEHPAAEPKRAGKFKDRKTGDKGAGGGEESGPESPPPTRAPRPR